MKSISEIIKSKIENLGKNKLSQRSFLVKELYEVYLLENKFENYHRYLAWLKKEKKKKTDETVREFKKVKLPKEKKYIKPFNIKFFVMKLAHIKTPDLYYLCSVKRDIMNRKGYKRSSFTKWLFYSIK